MEAITEYPATPPTRDLIDHSQAFKVCEGRVDRRCRSRRIAQRLVCTSFFGGTGQGWRETGGRQAVGFSQAPVRQGAEYPAFPPLYGSARS